MQFRDQFEEVPGSMLKSRQGIFRGGAVHHRRCREGLPGLDTKLRPPLREALS
jgi:hypothetical protein